MIRLLVVQVGRKTMTTRGLPFRDLVVFTAKGEDFCRAYRSADECNGPVALTWAMQDVFGVAVIEFENLAAPRVARFRFTSESSMIPNSAERAGQTFDSTRVVGWITHNALEALMVEDIDGDASDEYVILVWDMFRAGRQRSEPPDRPAHRRSNPLARFDPRDAPA
ncbi:hypothetical protein ACNOYE_34695 [Nannocystaceae bacterium ST9]